MKVKTTLITSLIVATILTFSVIEYVDAKIQADKIPEDKLIDRSDDWKDIIAFPDKFDAQDAKFRHYIKCKHPDIILNSLLILN